MPPPRTLSAISDEYRQFVLDHAPRFAEAVALARKRDGTAVTTLRAFRNNPFLLYAALGTPPPREWPSRSPHPRDCRSGVDRTGKAVDHTQDQRLFKSIRQDSYSRAMRHGTCSAPAADTRTLCRDDKPRDR